MTLSSEHVEKIVAVIKKDANGKGKLVRLHDTAAPQACVVGGLLVAAGVEQSHLDGRSDPNPHEHDLLLLEYGLGSWEITRLIYTNDLWAHISDRRRALTALVKSWEEGKPSTV